MNKHAFVVPAYGKSPYLEVCIESLLNQTVESTVIVTTSTPNEYIQNLAAKYRLTYIVNHDAKGIAADWNFALKSANANLATIAHQDDIYLPQFLEQVLAKTHNSERWSIAFTDYVELLNDAVRPTNANLRIKKILLWPFLLKGSIGSPIIKKSALAFGDAICCPSVTFNLEQLDNFQFEEDMTCALDWQAWYQLAQRDGAFVFVNQKLLQHRIHAESETTNQLKQGVRQAEEREIFQRIWGKSLGGLINRLYSLGHKSNLKDI